MNKQLTQLGNTQLSFGQAVELVQQGKLVARAGWNGKGMFIFMRPEDTIDIETIVNKIKSLPQSVKDYFDSIDDKVNPGEQGIKFTPYLCMKAADNTVVNGWLASQTDMLSSDWCEMGFIKEGEENRASGSAAH